MSDDLRAKVRELAGLMRLALPYLHAHQDEGPPGEGWKSRDLQQLIERIEREIKPSEPVVKVGADGSIVVVNSGAVESAGGPGADWCAGCGKLFGRRGRRRYCDECIG